MGYKEEYAFWLEDSYFDQETKDELLAIKDNETEIEDRFYKELEFGTGGLRGVIGAGTNRMNIYTVRKATQGLANYIKKQGVSSALLEVCFINDTDDMKLYNAKKHEIAKAIAEGIAEGFKLETNALSAACKVLFNAGIINSPDYWAKGAGYSDANTVLLIKKFADYVKRKGK